MDSSHQHLHIQSAALHGSSGHINPDGAALSPHLMPQLAPLPSVRTRLGRDLSERNIIIPPNKIISIEERFP